MRRLSAALCVLTLACRPAPPSIQGGAGSADGGPQPPQSVVLVSIDTLRADHLGAYGYGRETSPTLDALARGGALFESAYSPTTWTLPGHASMLTGLSPFGHGATDGTRRIPDELSTLAELLKQRGYHTGAVINGPFVAAEFGFGQGFDTFVERYRDDRALPKYQPLVLETLRSMREPFFLFVHYISVHSPYKPAPEFNQWAKGASRNGPELRQLEIDLAAGRATLAPEERQLLVDLYDGEIRTIDHAIAGLVGVLRNEVSKGALVILTADHGEEFLEHGSVLHGHRLYDEVLHVPLIVNGPGVKPGGRIAELASLVDIVPTVLGWLGAEPPTGLDGVSWAGSLRGGPSSGLRSRTLPLHTRGADSSVDLWGLRTNTAKLIVDQGTGRKEFYDLVADPRERTNLYPTPEARRLERQLENLTLRPASGPAVPRDESREEILKSLGYR